MRAVALNDADTLRPSIEMDTEVGRLRGTWRGSTAISQGESVDVELDVANPRSLADLVVDPQGNRGQGVLRGVIQAAFEDGVIVLQIGSSAVQVELEQAPPVDEIVGRTVDLIAEDLEFFPTGV